MYIYIHVYKFLFGSRTFFIEHSHDVHRPCSRTLSGTRFENGVVQWRHVIHRFMRRRERETQASRGWPVILDWSACERREWSSGCWLYRSLELCLLLYERSELDRLPHWRIREIHRALFARCFLSFFIFRFKILQFLIFLHYFLYIFI